MSAKAFFDTNVLLYIYSDDVQKKNLATGLFAEHIETGGVLISTQVVQEFYAAGSRKLSIPRRQLRAIATALLDLPLIAITALHIERAFEQEDAHKISFWDALILAAAESGGADLLYTEDLNHGRKYGSVLVRNPFVPER
jgi:predicted nucleic acid-binding protein